MDEIICPPDMDWDGNFISDDDMHALFANIPKGVNLEIVLDSCHSGSGTREMLAIKGLSVELSFKPRFLPPPVDIACREDEDMEVRRLLKGGNPMNHVLFAGCRDNQTSADANIGAVTMAPLHIIFANIPEKRWALLPEANCSRGCVPL